MNKYIVELTSNNSRRAVYTRTIKADNVQISEAGAAIFYSDDGTVTRVFSASEWCDIELKVSEEANESS